MVIFHIGMKLFSEVGSVVVIGNSTVGKTSVIKTFLSSGLDFPLTYNMTVGVEPRAKAIQITSTDDIKLLFQDSTGLDLYYGVLIDYWNKANMLLMVYDVTSQLSFENLIHWMELANNIKWKNESGQPIASAVFGNKTDLVGRRVVTSEKGKEVANMYHMQYFEGSAKMNEGVNDPFYWFADKWQHHNSELHNK